MILMNHAMMGAAGYQAASTPSGDQFFWTPDAADAGGLPSNLEFDWPVDVDTAAEINVRVEDGFPWNGSPCLHFSFGNNTFAFVRLLSINGVGIPEAEEIELCVNSFYFSSFNNNALAIKMQPSTQTGYCFHHRLGHLRTVGPGRTWSELGTTIENSRPSMYRLRASNTEQKAKAWLDGDLEPAAWGVEFAHTAFPGPGSPGVFNPFGSIGYLQIRSLGIGLNGAPAPMEPI